LILAGAPAYLSSSTQKAIADAPDHTDIRSLGYVDERTKAALLSGAEVFVYPSIYEGFGIPVLEAMHYGTPVIACDTSSIPEVLGDTGLLVPPGDSDGMSETIDILMSNDSLRTRLGDAGRERSKLFSWDLVAERTVEVYRQSVARL
jgi:glycosyltransferase involved in cell wall biosynthesis